MKIVEVTWDDSSSSDSWQSRSSAIASHDAPHLCVTVGVLVHRDKKAVTIASSIHGEHSVGGLWRIPTAIVKKFRIVGATRAPACDW